MPKYIDSEKIREAIKNYGKGAVNDGIKSLDVVDDIINIAALVDYLPAADVTPIRHGYWKGNKIANYEFETCSNCNNIYDCGEVDVKTFSQFYKYCPNCGAKMDGATNG